VQAEKYHAGGQTEGINMTKLTTAFPNSFAKVPKLDNSVFLNNYFTYIKLKNIHISV
jgi:hypothetical protein